MRMNKRTYEIKKLDYDGEIVTENVQGLLSTNFGIHSMSKTKETTAYNRDKYVVTHLGSGWRVVAFKRLKHARRFVDLTESLDFPTPWSNKDVNELQANRDLTMEIRMFVIEERRYPL